MRPEERVMKSIEPESIAPGRVERAAVLLFIVISIAMPFVRDELFPFSTFRLFPEAVKHYTEYRVMDARRRPLPLGVFGLQRNYWGYPTDQDYAVVKPPSIDEWGVVEPRELIVDRVRTVLDRNPALDRVLVQQTVIGPVEGDTLGVISVNAWTVDARR